MRFCLPCSQDAAEKPDGSVIKKNTANAPPPNRVKFIAKHFFARSLFLKNYITMVRMYPFRQACSVVLLKCKFLITCSVILTVFAAVCFPVICSNAVIVID